MPDGLASSLYIDLLENEGVPILHLVGDLDMHTSTTLRHRLQGLMHRGHSRIGLDLRRVGSLDPIGVSALVAEHEECRRTRSELVVLDASSEVDRVLRHLGLDHLLLAGQC